MTRLTSRLRRLDDRGASTFEFAVVGALLFGLTFALVDFGRVYFQWVTAEKATQLAVRMAVVRPPVCPGLPALNNRRSGVTQPRYGTPCANGAAPCAVPATVQCMGDPASPVMAAILGRTAALLPAGATAANFRFTYEDAGLGFLGGPYTPLITVELVGLPFDFLVLGPFARLLGGGGFQNRIAMPGMRATLTGEDLGHGGPG